MTKNQVLARVKEIGLVSVLRGPSPDLTVKMVEALMAGGVMGIEITYSTPNAAAVVKTLSDRYGDKILLGMGTVTTAEQVQEAKAAGAQFLVSPHGEAELAAAMKASGLSFMMGALTPTEVHQAWRWGSDIVKIFPGSVVGPSYLKTLRGPFPQIPTMPTGGVSADNVAQWFAAGAVAVGAGSELCPTDLAKAGKFDEISAKARAFVDAVKKAMTKSAT